MRRSDYLNPEAIKRQCIKAASRLEEDCKSLEIAGSCIAEFVRNPEVETESFQALKQQLEDYIIIIEAMQIANIADAEDFKSFGRLVGSELLDGENIYGQMENSLSMKESFLSNEEFYRNRMAATEDIFLQAYYHFKTKQYQRMADNSQRLYERWREKTERFDEIAAETQHLFVDSKDIDVLIQKGLTQIAGGFQNGAYVRKPDNEWKKQIKNIGVRLAMGYGDKGGEQKGPYMLWKRGLASDMESIRNMIHKYEEYADYSDEEITGLLIKLSDEGCAYVAFANIIVDEYRRKEEEFEKTFGFPLFLTNAIGIKYVNYNQLIVDLYCASDNHRKSWKMWQEYDVYDKNEDFTETVGRGTSLDDCIYRFERYMDIYGKAVKIENIACSASEVYQKCEEEIRQGNHIIIRTCPVRLVDSDGKAVHKGGGHAMTVTGLSDDGRIQVSSWGKIFYITPENPEFMDNGENFGGAYIRIQSVQF